MMDGIDFVTSVSESSYYTDHNYRLELASSLRESISDTNLSGLKSLAFVFLKSGSFRLALSRTMRREIIEVWQ